MPQSPAATVDVLIRFKDSAGTLPKVLSHLASQSGPKLRIVGIDTGSTDGSARLIKDAGGDVILWQSAYSHPKVLNFGMAACTADLVLVLSSHTVLLDPSTLPRMVEIMQNPRVACVSAKWDDDPYYSDGVSWEEVSKKGLKFGSIYSNSMGMLRRSCWVDEPFDESLEGSEDYAWALGRLRAGLLCARIDFPFDYHRSRSDRHFELAQSTFRIARHYGLRPAWMGARSSMLSWLKAWFTNDKASAELHRERLRAWWKNR